MQTIEIDRLRSALDRAKDYLLEVREEGWANLMSEGIERLDVNDLSFIEPMYLKVAPTCQVEELFISDPEPPMTEEEANAINDKFAEIVNELSNALKPFWNEIHNND